MRIANAELALLLLAAPLGAAAVPDPLFWGSVRDFHDQVEDGQFNSRIELHLLQYASEPGWRLDWAAAQYSGNGLFGEYGSTTTRELYVDSQIAVNLFPAPWFQLRYDRRDLEDGRFALSSQRLDAVFHVGRAWGLVLTGWPSVDKAASSVGAGLRLGAPRSPNMLEVRVLDERWIWNDKTGGEVRFSGEAFRLLADGSAAAGPWRLRGSVDWGLPYRARDRATARTTEGLQGFADLAAEYGARSWAAGARLTGARLRRTQSEAAGPALSLDRSWGRAVLSFRRSSDRWSASALAAWASQRDGFSSPEEPDGNYASDALMAGAEGGWQATPVFQLRLGYLASLQRAERSASGAGPLPARSSRQYLDKAHLRALYVFRPGMSIELLLSQAIRGRQFGGGSVKAVFVL